MTFTVKTIGCKVNTYESNKIKAELQNAGLIFIDANKKSEYKNLDYYIINTCSVTAVADKKSRQMIHSVKTANKNIKVIATGCYIDAHKDNIDKDIDKYFLNKDKMSLIDFVIKDSLSYKNASPLILSNQKGNSDKKKNDLSKIREFIKIQDGCNEYCTYCIIPYLRGNIKSRSDDEILDEIKEKVLLGTKEIVLTGIHLSSFGVDRSSKTYESEGAIDIGRKALIDIIKKIADIKIKNGNEGYDYLGNKLKNVLEVERIRLGSLEPRIINEDFIKELSSGELLEKFCANFCLSLQSGSDKILKVMNRHYTTKDFENACSIIRKYMPDATITTDVIVGFPGETESDFNESLEFVKKMRFYNPNIFPYSRRPCTKAADFDNQITKSVKHERATKMIAECEKITKEIYDAYDFSKHQILIEEEVIAEGNRYGIGYTKEYIKSRVLL